ncbi:MAG: hypothetical protein QM783_17295 [Phycisphaerales bacterium]
MRGKQYKGWIKATVVFFVTIGLLVGLEIADQCMPTSWRETWVWNTARSFSFSGATACFWLIALGLFGAGLLLAWHEHFWPTPDKPCKHCNYDRAGIDLDAPCPECGKIPDGAQSAKRLSGVEQREMQK